MKLERAIAKQFSNPAGLGGKLVSFVMNRQNRHLYEETIRLLALCDTDSVLDIGCGNGYVLHLLARRYSCIFAGIDISKSVIRDAARRNRRFVKNNGMALTCQNANAMSFADDSFHKIYTVNTVYFWESLDDTMAEIRRVLKPGGLFVNAFYSDETLSRFSHTQFGYRRFTMEQLISAGRTVGLAADVVPVLDGAAYCILYRGTGETMA